MVYRCCICGKQVSSPEAIRTGYCRHCAVKSHVKTPRPTHARFNLYSYDKPKCRECGSILRSQRTQNNHLCSTCEKKIHPMYQSRILLKPKLVVNLFCRNCGTLLRSKRTKINGLCSTCEKNQTIN